MSGTDLPCAAGDVRCSQRVWCYLQERWPRENETSSTPLSCYAPPRQCPVLTYATCACAVQSAHTHRVVCCPSFAMQCPVLSQGMVLRLHYGKCGYGATGASGSGERGVRTPAPTSSRYATALCYAAMLRMKAIVLCYAAMLQYAAVLSMLLLAYAMLICSECYRPMLCCYAESLIDTAYGCICLRARYAMPGTDIAYGATRVGEAVEQRAADRAEVVLS
eukprot:2787061-Rhodomonas_salina.2